MLTKKQKSEHFKCLQARNYRASLQLEGFDIEPTKLKFGNGSNGEKPETLSEAELIANLKQRYAR